MRTRTRIHLVLLTLLCACDGSPAPSPAATAPAASDAARADPPFVGRVWVTATPGHARGTIIVFLPDRSLLMTSCTETYRLSRWQITGDTIRWIEDTIPIQATVSTPRPNELRLEIEGRDEVQTYVAAHVPYVCPDSR